MARRHKTTNPAGSSPAHIYPHFAAYSAAGLLAALVLLFHKFIFSNSMLDSYDIMGFGLAHRRLLGEYFAAHYGIPLWDPYVLCGVPFIEAIHGGIFYPLTFIDFLGYTPRMIGFNFILHFWLAGLFMYAAARQLRLSQFASALAGAAYAFSPLMLSWVAPGHDGKIYAATLFPLVILFLDRLFERRRILDAALLGLVGGVLIVTPHQQIVYYVACTIVAYALVKSYTLFREKMAPREIGRRWLLLAGAIALALTLSAVQWLPSYLYITQYSPRSSQEQGVEYAAQFSLHTEELISLGWPEFCGADNLNSTHAYWGRNMFKDNSDAIGGTTLFLALLGLILPRRRSRLWWGLLAAGVLIYALGTHTPLFAPLVTILPLLDSMRSPTTAMFIFAFAAAILAGMAIDRILQIAADRQSKPRRLTWMLIAVPLAGLLLALVVSLLGESILRTYANLFYSDLLGSTTTLSAKWSYAQENLPFLIAGAWRAAIAVSIVCIAIAAVLKRKNTVAALIAIILTGIIVNGVSANRYIRTWDAHAVTDPLPATSFLLTHAGINRVGAFGLSMSDYQIGWYPLQASYGYHGKEPRWFNELLGPSDSLNYLRDRFVNLTGTRYLVIRQGHSIPPDAMGPRPLKPVAKYTDCTVYENENAFPRAYLVDSAVVMSDLTAIDHEVIRGSTDLRRVAILEQPPSFPLTVQSDPSASALIVSYDANRIEIPVSTNHNCLLILTDNYMPSWHALVDNQERPVLRAYGAFRSVEIPAGAKRVVFEYKPRSVTVGILLSLFGLGALAVVFGYQGWWVKRKQRA